MNDNNLVETSELSGPAAMTDEGRGDLRGTHTPTNPPVSWAGRAVGIAFLVIALGVGGAYVYETWPHQAQKSVVADTRLPTPAPR